MVDFLKNGGGGATDGGAHQSSAFGGRDVRNANMPPAHGADDDENWD